MSNPQRWLRNPQQFIFDNLTPGKWLYSAIALKEAAPIIHWQDDLPVQGLGIVFVRRMLIGMSIENLLKGILQAQGETVVVNGRLTRDFKTHSLYDLATHLKAVTVEVDEYHIMKDLTHYIRWSGRYPIPLRVDDVIPLCYSREVFEEEINLFNKLRDRLIVIGWDRRYDDTRIPLIQLARI